MNKKVVIALIIGIALGLAGGYFGAQIFGQKNRTNFQQRGSLNGQPRQIANTQRNSFGQIENISADKMTLKNRDGSSQLILITSETTYQKSVTATQSDFSTGASVVVNGKSNPDGSITATSIQSAPTNTGDFRGFNPVSQTRNNN